MGWLGGLTLAAIVVSWVLNEIIKGIFGTANSAVSNAAHGTVFGTVTALITAKGGMHEVTKSVRGLNLSKLDSITKLRKGSK